MSLECGFDLGLGRIGRCCYDHTDVTSETALQPAGHTASEAQQPNKCPLPEGDIEEHHHHDSDHRTQRRNSFVAACMRFWDDFVTDDEQHRARRESHRPGQ
jgi:hypothetical protein